MNWVRSNGKEKRGHDEGKSESCSLWKKYIGKKIGKCRSRKLFALFLLERHLRRFEVSVPRKQSSFTFPDTEKLHSSPLTVKVSAWISPVPACFARLKLKKRNIKKNSATVNSNSQMG